ncbi:MAG TPA: hypothetical protein PLX23_04115 [Candidatus Hydrogenedens sp.]|nr:hypothetical protein [Candidatus Hydrogenedens sp.]
MYYHHQELQAIRYEKWKLHFPHKYTEVEIAGKDGRPGKYIIKDIPTSLYNLENDISEQTNLAQDYPKLVERLKNMSLRYDNELRKNIRPALKV